MRTYIATITNQDFLPHVVVPSVLRITVTTPDGKSIRVIEDKGSIEELSKKFGFKVSGDTYDFTGFTGRKCNIEIDNDGYYHFKSMVDG